MFTRRSGRLQNQSQNLTQSPTSSPVKQPRNLSPNQSQSPVKQPQNLSQDQSQSPIRSPRPTSTPVKQNASPLPPQQNQTQSHQEPPGFQQQPGNFNSPPQIQKLAPHGEEDVVNSGASIPVENPEWNESAVQMGEAKKRKKATKVPVAVKRRKFNQRLSKLLTPKSALILLHELRPGCSYKVEELPGSGPPSFSAQVELENVIIGVGKGSSKSQAKNSAAENAIKTIVSNTMARHAANAEGETENSDRDHEDTPENLPWAGLASFAIYKMFSEWQSQGADLLSLAARPGSKSKAKVQNPVSTTVKKGLPENAADLHPAVVLNMMQPGLTAVEVERENGPKCRVKMAYVVEGVMYTGVGGNKKDAKKEAAKAVLEGYYGLTYA